MCVVNMLLSIPTRSGGTDYAKMRPFPVTSTFSKISMTITGVFSQCSHFACGVMHDLANLLSAPHNIYPRVDSSYIPIRRYLSNLKLASIAQSMALKSLNTDSSV